MKLYNKKQNDIIHTNVKSEMITKSRIRESLNEIFDVLLISMPITTNTNNSKSNTSNPTTTTTTSSSSNINIIETLNFSDKNKQLIRDIYNGVDTYKIINNDKIATSPETDNVQEELLLEITPFTFHVLQPLELVITLKKIFHDFINNNSNTNTTTNNNNANNNSNGNFNNNNNNGINHSVNTNNNPNNSTIKNKLSREQFLNIIEQVLYREQSNTDIDILRLKSLLYEKLKIPIIRRKSHSELKTKEEMELMLCRDKPYLEAHKVTEKLVRSRSASRYHDNSATNDHSNNASMGTSASLSLSESLYQCKLSYYIYSTCILIASSILVINIGNSSCYAESKLISYLTFIIIITFIIFDSIRIIITII